ncbi:MAG TPA: protein kinase [Pyrinomonadaceae bacterium]|nr:protein kinase [Pyrinomonadaceae bacterium]
MPELKLQQSRLDGRYDIIECLGRGSYAEIYVAHDNAASVGAPTTVVIKALNMFLQEAPDLELEKTLVTNFQNEAVALDRVRHPHIISRLGHGTAIDLTGTTFHYIVLEYLSGGDMAALSRNHPLPIDRALFYLEQVCSGLAHAHACGVIHRDIKPQNLLLNADRQIVKIADFGVARLEAHDGAITRVGTNMYAAPEHNPLVHTGQLDIGIIATGREHLTPAADIYSLAKTTYALVAGESPRRFAQRSITDFPEAIRDQYWAERVVKVLERATQTRLDQRYQTVPDFWDELAEAALPPTKLLVSTGVETASQAILENSEARRRPSDALSVEPDEFTQPPPQPRFQPVHGPVDPITAGELSVQTNVTPLDRGASESAKVSPFPRTARVDPEMRPKIVVPVSPGHPVQRSPSPRERIPEVPGPPRDNKSPAYPRAKVAPTRTRPFIVAAALILAFTGMLLATHRYVTSQWNPFAGISTVSDVFVIGREGVTTTDVRLRSDASTLNPPVGLAENGSRVKILATDDNWYEVQVLEHGRAKADPFTSDRGWINKKFVRFD